MTIWNETFLNKIRTYWKGMIDQTKRMKASPFLLERCSNRFVTFKVT